jgi:hypothetical protein
MQYLNAIRSAIDLANIEHKPMLESQLKQKAVEFIKNFNEKNSGKLQEEISSNVTAKMDDVAKLLGENGIKNAYKRLNIAKDFQNFNDEHCNIVTLSNVKDKQGRKHIAVEGEVALKGLTEEQQLQYKKIINDQQGKPRWYDKMTPFEQSLVKKYADKIIDGQHVISTQLRQIVGMKNAFEKITAIVDENSKLEIIHESKHAGTLVSFSRDEKSRPDITGLNARQAQEWIGEERRLHTNTLNSGTINSGLLSSIVRHPDMEIVKETNLAMNTIKGINTNTAFNQFRVLGGVNNLKGAEQLLENLSNNLGKQDDSNHMSEVKSHLKPRGWFSRLLGINKPKGNSETLINTLFNTNQIDKNTSEILKNAVSLRKDIESANIPFFRLFGDKENINVSISRKLNYLTHQISKSDDKALQNVTKYETLTMCASGKDRTGLAEHDQTSSALALRLGIDVKDVDKVLLQAGHTVGQAGGVYAGGATIGCYGTLAVTGRGFPNSRKHALQGIIEPSAQNRRIQGDSKQTDREYKKNHTNKLMKKPIRPGILTSYKKITPDTTPAQKQLQNTKKGL